ncbi:hypothetical protein SESBI_17349 [Sesbania bispinosa]|nr:hypothetical protein SESBI_17349 [Sesbania bispinosa]
MVVAKGISVEAVIVVATVNFTEPSNWWRDIKDSSLWLYGIFHILTAFFEIAVIVTLVFPSISNVFFYLEWMS